MTESASQKIKQTSELLVAKACEIDSFNQLAQIELHTAVMFFIAELGENIAGHVKFRRCLNELVKEILRFGPLRCIAVKTVKFLGSDMCNDLVGRSND